MDRLPRVQYLLGTVRTELPRLALLVAVALSVAACGDCGENDRRPGRAAVEVSRVEADLVLRGAGVDEAGAEIDLEDLVRGAAARARTLRLVDGGDGGRLRVSAVVSTDGATGELHARVEASLDRAGTVPLDWEVTRVRPAPPGGPHSSADVREHLSAAVAEAVGSVDVMASVATAEHEDELIRALRRDEPAARAAAARALGRRRSAAAVEPLCAALGRESGPESRELLRALAAIGDDSATPCMLRWAGRDEGRLRLVVEALGALRGERARSALESLAADAGPAGVRRLAGRRLAALDGRRAARGGEEHEEHEPPAAIRPYLKALEDPDRRVRIGATHALGETRSPHAVEPLCDALERQGGEEQLAALDALAATSQERAIPCLLRWASTDERRLVLVIPALARIPGPEARNVLEMMAREHEEPAIRGLAEAALEDQERGAEASGAAPSRGAPGRDRGGE